MYNPFHPKDSPLRVQRVHRYSVPRYPAHTDPDPTTTPEPLPYPWMPGVVAAMLAVTQASCEKTQSAATPVAAAVKKASKRELTSAELSELDAAVSASRQKEAKGDANPFALKLDLSGLPYVSSPYGTGAPMPMDSEIARMLIRRIFSEQGLTAEPKTFNEKDFSVTADVYDAEKKIGFVIGDWESMDQTAWGSWMTHEFFRLGSRLDSASSDEERKRLEQVVDSTSKWLFERRTLTDAQRDELDRIQKLPKVTERLPAYLALLATIDEQKVSMAEVELADKQSDAHQRYLAVVSMMDKRCMPYGVLPEFSERLSAIEKQAEQQKFADDSARWKWVQEKQAPIQEEMNRQRLTSLARAVREYIAWARRSGVQ